MLFRAPQEYSNAAQYLKIFDQIYARLLDGVNINKIKRLFSVTIAFKILLKGTRFYGKIALLTSDQDSVIQ